MHFMMARVTKAQVMARVTKDQVMTTSKAQVMTTLTAQVMTTLTAQVMTTLTAQVMTTLTAQVITVSSIVHMKTAISLIGDGKKIPPLFLLEYKLFFSNLRSF